MGCSQSKNADVVGQNTSNQPANENNNNNQHANATANNNDNAATTEQTTRKEEPKQEAAEQSSETTVHKEESSSKKPTIAIIYYSMYGHVATLAESIKKGVEKAGDVDVKIYQMAETLPDDVLEKMGAPAKKDYPIASPETIRDADGVLFGIPTRFGSTPAQMRSLLDACGGLWGEGALVGKPAGIFVSTGSQSGGQESTAWTTATFLAHNGMIFVPLGYRDPKIFNMDEVHGGSAYGAGTFAGSDGSRQPSQLELDLAVTQGESFTAIVKKLTA